MRTNLLSVGKADDAGYKVVFENQTGTVYNQPGQPVVSATKQNGLYIVDEKRPAERCCSAVCKSSSVRLWHLRLSQLNIKSIMKLSTSNIVKGIDNIKNEHYSCQTCALNEICEKSYPKQADKSVTEILHPPSIFATYRIGLFCLEAKVRSVKGKVVPLGRVQAEMEEERSFGAAFFKNAQTVSGLPRPAEMVVNAVGIVKTSGATYFPVLPAQVFNTHNGERRLCPQPERVGFSSLRRLWRLWQTPAHQRHGEGISLHTARCPAPE